MRLSQTSNELMYQYEILRARNEIRDHFSDAYIKDIYENTGQLLTLIRMKLIFALKNPGVDANSEISASGDIIGQVINNLKLITTLLFPENEILSDWGFVKSLMQELKIDEVKVPGDKIKVKGNPCSLNAGRSLMLFQIIIEIMSMIKKEYNEEGLCLEIGYTRKKMRILISFHGDEISYTSKQKKNDNLYIESLTIEERIRLIDATIKSKKVNDGRRAIMVTVNI